MKQNETDLTPKIPKYICDVCEIKFNSRSTLWRHKKKCTSPQCVSIETEDKDKLIRLLIDKLSESGNNLNNSTKQPREDKKIISKIATSIPIEG